MSEERFLLFSAAGERYAFQLREVSEVMEMPAAFPFPRAPRHFMGVINFHGTLTALVDLAAFLGLRGRRRPGKILVLDTRSAHLALAVDGVTSIIARESVSAESPGEEPLTASLLETAEGEFRLLKLEILLHALEQGL